MSNPDFRPTVPGAQEDDSTHELAWAPSGGGAPTRAGPPGGVGLPPPAPYPGSNPAPYPGSNPETYPGSNPAPYPGSNPAPQAGSYPVPYAGSNPAPQAGSYPVPYAGSNPAPQAGSYPVPYTGPNPASYLGPYSDLYAGVVTPRPPRRIVATAVAATGSAVVVAAFGLLVGWLWAEIAPRVAVIKVDGGFVYADSEPEEAIAADGWFLILGVTAGVIFAVLAWVLLRRYRGVAVLVGLTLGSLVAAGLALWMGHRIGLAQFQQVRDSAAIGARLDAPLQLRLTDLDPGKWWPPKATGVVAVQALAVAFAYTCLAGFSGYAGLRPSESPAERRDESQDVRPDQFGPGFTGSSDSATGTART